MTNRLRAESCSALSSTWRTLAREPAVAGVSLLVGFLCASACSGDHRCDADANETGILVPEDASETDDSVLDVRSSDSLDSTDAPEVVPDVIAGDGSVDVTDASLNDVAFIEDGPIWLDGLGMKFFSGAGAEVEVRCSGVVDVTVRLVAPGATGPSGLDLATATCDGTESIVLSAPDDWVPADEWSEILLIVDGVEQDRVTAFVAFPDELVRLGPEMSIGGTTYPVATKNFAVLGVNAPGIVPTLIAADFGTRAAKTLSTDTTEWTDRGPLWPLHVLPDAEQDRVLTAGFSTDCETEGLHLWSLADGSVTVLTCGPTAWTAKLVQEWDTETSWLAGSPSARSNALVHRIDFDAESGTLTGTPLVELDESAPVGNESECAGFICAMDATAAHVFLTAGMTPGSRTQVHAFPRGGGRAGWGDAVALTTSASAKTGPSVVGDRVWWIEYSTPSSGVLCSAPSDLSGDAICDVEIESPIDAPVGDERFVCLDSRGTKFFDSLTETLVRIPDGPTRPRCRRHSMVGTAFVDARDIPGAGTVVFRVDLARLYDRWRDGPDAVRE